MVANLFVASVVAFVSTTIDDIFAVIFLYIERKKSDTDGSVSFIKVMIGQAIGFTILVLVSLMGMVLGVVFPLIYIDLIGFIPLCFGCKKLYDSIYEDCQPNEDDKDKSESTYLLPKSDGKTHDFNSINGVDEEIGDIINNKEINDNVTVNSSESVVVEEVTFVNVDGNDNEELEEAQELISKLPQIYKDLLDPLILESAIFALLCGSDNISVYISLFASQKPTKVLVIIAIFYVLLGVNGIIAYSILQFRFLLKRIEMVSKYLIGILLIILGIDILSESVLWPAKYRLN